MPLCDAVVCHAGHGTVARSLASGVPVVACGHAGDQAENAARVRWAGVGVSLPRRFQTPAGVRLAVHRLLADPSYRRRAEELRDWAAAERRPQPRRGRSRGARRGTRRAQRSALAPLPDHKNPQRAG